MKSKALKILAAAILIVALFPTLNCKKEPEKISVRLKWQITSAFAGDVIALEKGIFEKNGLDVTINEGGFNLDPIKLVASGSDHFGNEGPERIMVAQEEGLPLVCIAAIFQTSPVVFVAKTESGITTPKDFEGRNIGIKPGIDVMMVYEALMKKEGVDRSKIKEIPVQFAITPFLEDQVQVYPTYINNIPIKLDLMGVDHVVIDPRDYGIDIYGMCIFTTEKMIKENPKIVERYLKSVLEAYEWAMENRDEATQIIIDYNEKLDYDHQRGMMDAIHPLLTEGADGKIGWMNKERWESTRQLYVDVGMIKGTVDIDSIYTMRFLEKIYK